MPLSSHRDFEAALAFAASSTEHTMDRLLPKGDSDEARVFEAMRYSSLGGGKRLRAFFVLAGATLFKVAALPALRTASAIEFVHAYSLIHDDLPAMDDDDLRRGQPTSHKKFGEALAILAGDALLTGAFQVLAEGCPAAQAAVSILELAKSAGATGMVGGQVLDLAAEGKVQSAESPKSASDLEGIHRRKTGALIRASVRLGLIAAQGDRPDENVHDALDRFATSFGLAFQIADDLLDVQGTDDRTGKRVGKDAARGKLTFPGLLGVDQSRSKCRDLYVDAIAALDALGEPAQPLVALARQIMDRDR